jgi:hypothetical protein
MAKDKNELSAPDVLAPLRECVGEIGQSMNADVVLYSGTIAPPGDSKLFQCIRSFRKRPNILLHLTTNGGLPDSAYRIGRCVQKMYPPPGRVVLFVDSFCKSAGTLVALGADEIVMSEMAELGPLDVQVGKEDALAERTSGLTPTKAIEILSVRAFACLEDAFLKLRFRSGLQITTRTALEIAASMTTGLFSPIFGQIDPMRLGEIERAMSIARDYGTRLARGNQKEESLERLIDGYSSHGFVIDKEEAAELFQCVRHPSELEDKLSDLVVPFVIAGQKAADDDKSPIVEFLSILVEKSEIQGASDGRKAPRSRRLQRATRGNGAPPVPTVRGQERNRRSLRNRPGGQEGTSQGSTGKNGASAR